MSTVIYDISMSLDGYVRAADPTPDEPLGAGGEVLHTWAMNDTDDSGSSYVARGAALMGAMICGRVTYDDSIRWWQADGPSGPARLPLFVVTHAAPAESPADGVYTFVTSGIEDALAQARAAAGDKAVAIMGGPAVANQYLRAGLVDEVSVHVVPYLFGGGTQLTEALPAHVALDPIEQIATENATHLRYRVAARQA